MFHIVEDISGNTGYSSVARNLYKSIGKYMPVSQGTNISSLTKDDFILVRPFFQDWRSLNTEARIIGHYALESTKLHERLVRECNDDRMSQVWVPSNYVKSIAVENGIIEDKLKVIPHGFWPETFKNEGVSEHPSFRFGFCGGFTGLGDRKGADLIAEASRKLYKERQDFEVYFKINTTYGGNMEVYQQLVAPNHILDFENYPDEKMGQVYNSFDAFITASSGEAFNMTLLEAMACGLPCISPLNTGERDFASQIDYPLLQFQEVPARYSPWDIGNWFKPDVDEIVEKMKQVLDDKPKRRSYNLTGYTWDEVAKKAISFIK
jgi:glycosyltransferase involved in cell wall biosynthesis